MTDVSKKSENWLRFAEDDDGSMFPIERSEGIVSWMVVERITQRRRFGLGKEVVTRVVEDEQGHAKFQRMDSDDIPTIKDPDLKMALRLADAAKRMGWIRDKGLSSYAHFVAIEATDEGAESKLVRAYYPGHPDQLMADLHRFAPQYEDN